MKKVFLTTIFTIAMLFTTAQIKVYSGGKAIVGSTAVTPTYFLEVADVTSGDVNVRGLTHGYRIGGNLVLWQNNITTSIFVGSSSGLSTTGADNSFFGYFSGYANTSGANNVFLGSYAGAANITGGYNVFTGRYCGRLGTASEKNTFSGYQAGYTNTANNNVFFGYRSGYLNTTGTSNTFIGFEACSLNTTAGENVAVGYQAMALQSYTATSTYNVAVGTQALYSNQPTTTSEGARNSALGYRSLYTNSTGYQNTGIGFQALNLNLTGYYNTATGHNALQSNSTGYYNTANGLSALYTSTGYRNTASGAQSLYGTTGNYNTACGMNSGYTLTTGSNNTFLGFDADVAAACSTHSNVTALGYQALVPTNANSGNYVRIGNGSVQTTWVQVDWSIGSDRRIKNNIKENVPGLVLINALKPVTYHYDIHKQNALAGYPVRKDSSGNMTIDTTFWEDKYNIERTQFTGFIAQQVDSAAQQLGFDFSGVDKSGDIMGLRYSQFVVPLVKAVQELSKTQDSLMNIIANMKGAGQRTNTNDAQGKNEATHNVDLANNGNAILYQNEPNPFDGNTVIRYFIPENTIGNAYVAFYDMYGKEIKKLEITEKGFGKIDANTENLAGGIYSYSIILNDKVADTKKMIKNK